MPEIQGILFDKDGTLFDFNATWGAWTRSFLIAETGGDAALVRRLAEALGYDLEREAFERDSIVIAGTVEDVSGAALPFLPETSQTALIARMNAQTADVPQVEVTPLVPFLLGLSARGLDLGIATNDSEYPARAQLRAAGVEQSFDFIAGYDSGFGGKPSTGQLDAFASTLGLNPAHCAMVGDSLHDLHAGRAAGFVTVGVLTGVATAQDLAPAADVILPSIAHLPDWLDD